MACTEKIKKAGRPAHMTDRFRIGTRIGAGFMLVMALMMVIVALSATRLVELRAASGSLASFMLPSRQALFRRRPPG